MINDDGALHFSKLKNISDSPMHYHYFNEIEREDTDDYVTGRVAHRIVLLGEIPEAWKGQRKGSDYKAAVAANGGEILPTESMLSDAMHMAESVLASRLAMDILRSAPNRETPKIWFRRGIKCAGRMDAWGPDVLVDLKTAKNAHPRAFQWQGKTLGYREQLAWYDVGLGTVPDPFEPKWRNCFNIAVGKKAPWPVSIHRVWPLALQQAHVRVESWLDTYQECLRTGKWPGWDEKISDWDVDVEFHDDDEDDEIAA